MSQPSASQHRQHWLVLVNDPDLQNFVKSMQAIWEFEPFEPPNFFQTSDWLMTVKSGSTSVVIPEVALIELCPDQVAPANQEYLQQAPGIPRLARIPVILLCTNELSDAEKSEFVDRYGARAIIAKPLPGLFELNRVIAEATAVVD